MIPSTGCSQKMGSILLSTLRTVEVFSEHDQNLNKGIRCVIKYPKFTEQCLNNMYNSQYQRIPLDFKLRFSQLPGTP